MATFVPGELTRVPGYLPYPGRVSSGPVPVPNASAINSPQAQFAPKYLPPGSPSVQPYRYPDQARYRLVISGEARPNPSPSTQRRKLIVAALALGAVAYLALK